MLEAAMQRSVVIIPAKSKEALQTAAKLKVAAYCRVSTDQEEQESSYEAQISYYTEKIGNNIDWSLVKIFADEGITGTQDKKRDQFIEMIRLCRKTEVLDPTKNGSVLAAQQRLDELANNMNELLRLATTPESGKTAMADIQKFSDEMKALREFIETEKSKAMTAEQDTEQMNAVLERLEQQDFTLTEYDDVVVRQMVDMITVVDKQTVRIRFIGGMDIVQNL